MNPHFRLPRPALALAAIFASFPVFAVATPAAAPAPTRSMPESLFFASPEDRQWIGHLTEEDHADMLRQLGIAALRPGRNGSTAPGTPNPANYDPALANPYPDYPDALVCRDGTRVTTADQWWQKRRPEIVEDFEREVYGRIPAGVPKVTWTVTATQSVTVGGRAAVARQVIGHVDNSACPSIAVDIRMAVVTPTGAAGPVPTLIMFGSGNLPGVDSAWPKWAGP